MSISDHLDEIEARIIRAREGRHIDRYMVLDVDAPAMLAALRAVLELHVSQFDRTVDHNGEPGTYCDMCNVGPWPCPTVRAVQAALGEEA